jgi:hypothetical protein
MFGLRLNILLLVLAGRFLNLCASDVGEYLFNCEDTVSAAIGSS